MRTKSYPARRNAFTASSPVTLGGLLDIHQNPLRLADGRYIFRPVILPRNWITMLFIYLDQAANGFFNVGQRFRFGVATTRSAGEIQNEGREAAVFWNNANVTAIRGLFRPLRLEHEGCSVAVFTQSQCHLICLPFLPPSLRPPPSTTQVSHLATISEGHIPLLR